MLDVRTRGFFEQLPTMFADLSATGTLPEILFLEAADDVIVRRQESVRRPHPLQGDGRLLDGIDRERETLATLRAAADLVIDTSSLNIHQLGSRVAHAYGGSTDDQLRVTLLSFGFKNGIPGRCRHGLRRALPAQSALDSRAAAADGPEQTGQRLRAAASRAPRRSSRSMQDLMAVVSVGYVTEGKRFATLAIGCTGGKHRSTAMAEELARRLRATGSADHRPAPRSGSGVSTRGVTRLVTSGLVRVRRFPPWSPSAAGTDSPRR